MTKAVSLKKYRSSLSLNFCKLSLCSVRTAHLSVFEDQYLNEICWKYCAICRKNTSSSREGRLFLQFISFGLFRIFFIPNQFCATYIMILQTRELLWLFNPTTTQWLERGTALKIHQQRCCLLLSHTWSKHVFIINQGWRKPGHNQTGFSAIFPPSYNCNKDGELTAYISAAAGH